MLFNLSMPSAEKDKKGLPPEFQQVEYLESTGTQFLNSRYLLKSNNFKVICDFEYTAPSSSASIFGSQTTSQYTIAPYYDGGSAFYVGTSKNIAAITTELNTRYRLIVHAYNGILHVSLNGVESKTLYNGELLKTRHPYIFCNNNNGVAAQFCSMKLYRLQFREAGIIVRDYIPCYKKATKEAAAFEIVNNVFEINGGSGVFNVGADTAWIDDPIFM